MTRRSLADATIAAQAVVSLLAPGCERIEVAGSIRRKAAEVKDIEIVVAPMMSGGGLFGDLATDHLNGAIHRAMQDGMLIGRDVRTGEPCMPYKLDGRRFYPLIYRAFADWPVDLFCVRAPAQWGAIFAIRTGPADYSARLVTRAKERGLRCTEGHLVDSEGRTVDTPEEQGFITACGLTFLPPEQRK